jgi:5-methylcytosine-specific restriction protein B
LAPIASANATRRTWWICASPAIRKWDKLFETGLEDFKFGRLKKNYAQVRPGDLVIGYQASPVKQIVALARIKNLTGIPDRPIELEPVLKLADGLTFDELKADELLSKSEPMKFNCQGTLFALTSEESEYLLSYLGERDPGISELFEDSSQPQPITVVQQITFHPSYSYEDFIEGFRPKDSGNGLVLSLEDGLFKRLCRTAQANPEGRYLLIIDEINRANVAKVFGEIITLLEKDKRGLEIELPQSRERFQVPKNVFILGTMNTADKSIRLLDAALRRRFSFVELMPDLTLLEGAQIDNLDLAQFLEFLNRKIASREGREKQIGHAFLMDENGPLTDPVEFARRFQQDIVPLLQEYCYDDYNELADYLGNALIDRDTQSLDDEILKNPERLLETLALHIAPGS